MKILNIHTRIIDQPKSKISPLLATLSTSNDVIWPREKWPPMRFKEGLKVGANGGHGPIRYSIEKYIPGDLIQFRFTQPAGFDGVHRFEIIEMEEERTQIKHILEANTNLKAYLSWSLAIRWLHDACVEDAFDNLENYFLTEKKSSNWSWWVNLCRNFFKPGKHTKKTTHPHDIAA